MSLAGKTIAITGAARGLGQEFARHLATLGANLIVGDINDCGATVDLVTAAGGKAAAVRLDVIDPASAQAMVEAGLAEFGRLDGLVNNAALYGALKGGRFDGIPESEWDACMAVNVKGIWNCCKAAVPAMRAGDDNKGGSIVNIASLAATYGMPYGLHYTTSKAAVIGPHPRPRARAGARPHPGQRAGTERRADRRHQRILWRQARPRAGGGQGRADDPAQPGAGRPHRHGGVALVG
jgi:NAD(P)-dependent dehydrogenase (short-subunit alcohol dehydrogenase family)